VGARRGGLASEQEIGGGQEKKGERGV